MDMPTKVVYLYPGKNAEIHCVHCGAELRQKGTDRCPDCGRALYEICEIVYDFVSYENYEIIFFGRAYKGCYRSEIPALRFLAWVIEGPYASAGFPCYVGESPNVEGANDGPQFDNQEHINAVNDLARKLREDGWDHLPTGGLQWYNLRFRRRVW